MEPKLNQMEQKGTNWHKSDKMGQNGKEWIHWHKLKQEETNLNKIGKSKHNGLKWYKINQNELK